MIDCVKKSHVQWIAFFLCAVISIRCSDLFIAQNGGGGSETINATVIVSDTNARFDVDIKSGSSLTIRIYSDRYKPYERTGFADSLLSDSAASIAWRAPASGDYNFIMSTDPSKKAAFISGVRLGYGIRDTIVCGMKKCIAFKGAIQSGNAASPYLLFIQGSPFFCISDTARRFVMADLPSGCYFLKTRPVSGRLFMKINNYMVNTDSLGDNVNVVIEDQ